MANLRVNWLLAAPTEFAPVPHPIKQLRPDVVKTRFPIPTRDLSIGNICTNENHIIVLVLHTLNMLAIKSKTSKSEAITPNLLPCRIHHDGKLEVSQRHWDPKTEQGNQ
jgi:hypothetical protein